jgi:predicted PurR-regulated permease PerM
LLAIAEIAAWRFRPAFLPAPNPSSSLPHPTKRPYFCAVNDYPNRKLRGVTPARSDDKFSLWDRRTACALFTLLTFLAVGAFIYAAWKVIVAFIFAVLMAYLLDPIVNFVQHRSRLSKGRRSRAVLQTYMAIGVLLALLIILAGPRLATEGRRLVGELPVWMEKLTSGQIAWQIGSQRGWSHTTQEHVQHWLSGHRHEIIAWAQHVGAFAAQFAVNALWIILVPILAIFFLLDGSLFAETIVDLVDRRRQRQFLRGLLADLDTMLAHYIRAQLVLAGLTLVVLTALLTLIRLPYGTVLGVIAGVLEFIPLAGPLVAAITILGIAFLTSYHHILLVAILLGAWRVAQDYVTDPRIMGHSLELHPLAALFAILAGGEVAGVIGVYLSIPIAATLRIFWRRWRAYSEASSASAAQIPTRRSA